MILETGRMLGEPIGPEHQDDLVRLLGDPRVGATLGGVASAARVAASIEALGEHFARYGFGFWVWREKASGDVVARGGIEHTHVGGRDEVEVGWAVMPDRWNEGFATELGAASLRAGFEQHGLETVVAFTLPHNLPSRRVMEKIGLSYERNVVHAGMDHVLYRASRVT